MLSKKLITVEQYKEKIRDLIFDYINKIELTAETLEAIPSKLKILMHNDLITREQYENQIDRLVQNFLNTLSAGGNNPEKVLALLKTLQEQNNISENQYNVFSNYVMQKFIPENTSDSSGYSELDAALALDDTSVIKEPFSYNEEAVDKPAPEAFQEEIFWEQALAEFESSDRRAGLWAKCYSESDGNEAQAKAKYLRLRVEQIAHQYQASILERQSIESAAAKCLEDSRIYGDSSDKHNGNQFVVIMEGIIKDSVTGLMWEQRHTSGTMKWKDGVKYAKNLQLGGYSDWRMPTKEEWEELLLSVTNKNVMNHMESFFDKQGFKNTASHYWSSTTDGNDSDYAWLINFSDGCMFKYFKTYSYNVRSVRSGK